MNSTNIDESCTFCKQYIRGTSANFWASNWGEKYGQTSDVVYETESILVVAGLGALSEGYVLLIPKIHYFSVAQLPDSLHSELEALKLQVRSFLEKTYDSVVFFEHGMVVTKRRAGACIDHVHLNAFPCKFDIRLSLQEVFTEKRIGSFRELRKFAETGTSYIFIENQLGEMFVYTTPEPTPSQFVRRIWARGLGKSSEWDWAVFINQENVAQTIKAFKSFRDHIEVSRDE